MPAPVSSERVPPCGGWVGFVVAVLFSAYWTACAYPTPEAFLQDPDGGYQLAGAINVMAGVHPYVGFPESYGPLTFYASAAAQLLSGQRIVGEMVLVCAGFGVGYGLFYLVVARATGRRALAAVALVVALCLIPRLYKYYIVLGPLLALAAAWSYFTTPTRARFWGMAVAVAICGLFRPDFGMYSLVAVIAGFFVDDTKPLAVRFGDMARFGLAVLVAASPWLVWITARGGLWAYLEQSSLEAAVTAAGMALPFPAAGSGFLGEERAVLFRLFQFLPLLAGVTLLLLWRRLGPVARRRLTVLVVLAQFGLLQSMHRSDWGHLLQAIPVALVAAFWLASLPLVAEQRQSARWVVVPAVIATLLIIGCVSEIVVARSWPAPGLGAVGDKLAVFSGSKEEVVAAVARLDSENANVALIRHIRAHAKPGQKIAVLPALPQLSYLSDRALVGGQLAMLPGYFSSKEDQQRMIRAFDRSDVALLVLVPGQAFDGMPERELSQFAPAIDHYVKDNFTFVAHFGSADVFVPARGSTPH